MLVCAFVVTLIYVKHRQSHISDLPDFISNFRVVALTDRMTGMFSSFTCPRQATITCLCSRTLPQGAGTISGPCRTMIITGSKLWSRLCAMIPNLSRTGTILREEVKKAVLTREPWWRLRHVLVVVI